MSDTTKNSTSTPTGEGGVNVSKYKSQRSILSSDKREISPEEINALMVRAGKGVRCSPSRR